MATALPGPYEMELKYRISGFAHKLRINCVVSGSAAPGDLFNDIQLVNRAGTTQSAQLSLDGFWNQCRTMFHTSVVVEEVTLWKYNTGTLQKTFISTSAPANPTGSYNGTPTMAHQTTMTFRTANGGIVKNTLLETSITGDAIGNLVPNASGGGSQRVAAYWLSSAGWMIGRDDSFPVSALRIAETQNEVIYRKRYRLNI